MALRFRILVLISFVFLSSCMISISKEDYEKNYLSIPAITQGEEKALEDRFFSQGDWPGELWWQQYGNQELNKLVAISLENNPSLQAIREKINYAQSQVTIKKAALYPLVYFNADDNWSYLSQNGIYRALNPAIPLAGSVIDFSLSFSYEFDFWGKYRNLYHAAQFIEKARQAEAFQVKILTSCAVCQAYFALRTNLMRKKLYEQLTQVRKRYYSLQDFMRKNSLYSLLEPLLSEESVFAAEQSVLDLEQEIAVNIHTVNVLAGRGPEVEFSFDEPMKVLPDSLIIPKNISSELIARRPDVMARLWQTESYAREVGAAKADFFPNINLSLPLGYESLSWPKLFQWASKTLSLVPGLSLPVYTAGAIGANVDAKLALFNEAVFEYNNLMLESFKQVSDLLAIGRSIYGEKEKQNKIVSNASQRYKLTLMRSQSGLDNDLKVCQFLEELIVKQIQDVELLYQQYLVSINLAKSLGGGYFSEGANP